MTDQTYEERQGRGLHLQIAIPGCLPMRFRRELALAFQEYGDDYSDPEICTFLVKSVRDFYARANHPVLHGENKIPRGLPELYVEKAMEYIKEMLLSTEMTPHPHLGQYLVPTFPPDRSRFGTLGR